MKTELSLITGAESIEMTRTCAKDLTARINSASEDLAGMLKRAHDEKAWQALGYDDWKSYVKAELKFSEQRSFQLLDFATIRAELADSTIVESKNLPTAEGVTRELKKVEPEQRPAVYAAAVEAADGKRPTAKQVQAAAFEVRREIKLEAVKEAVNLPDAKFRVVYADPPWKYGDQLTEDYGAVKFHYPAMTITELCALPVKEIIEADAVLFLWVTSPLLEECFPIIKAWGFKYKTSVVWWKMAHNFGHYVSVQHELLLICTRGSCTPDIKELLPSVISVKRGKHSAKPEEARAMIDTMYPHGKRIELFRRGEAPDGWSAWGNEVCVKEDQ
jgi:N6-adenosine-specific RNA methylase IME4